MPEPTDTTFLWGVATSAYQSEGGFNGPGEPQTNWAKVERDGEVMKLGRAADFLTRYPEDFEACRSLGLNAFRLGVSWSRIQPTPENDKSSPPPFDEAALDHYGRVLVCCLETGLQPVVTLHHFAHPAWLGIDAWLDGETPALFESYVAAAVTGLNRRLIQAGHDPLRLLITINEPNMLVLNTYLGHQFPAAAPRRVRTLIRAYDMLMTAHVRAYRRIHSIYRENQWHPPMVTLNNYCSDLYWSDKMALDLLALRERGIARDRIDTHIAQKARAFEESFRAARIPLHRDIPYYFGTILKWIGNRVGRRQFNAEVFPNLLDVLYEGSGTRVFDYLGLDYYDPFTAHAFRLPVFRDHEFKNKSFRSWMMNSLTSKWWDWRVLPRGLHFFCETYSRDFDNRPVLIAENGMALRRRPDNSAGKRRDGMTRSQFLRLHVHEAVRIVQSGVPLIGYLHWSLFDNYEWGSYTPRFGLFSLDYQRGTDRLPEDHLGDRAAETYAKLVAEAKLKMGNARQVFY